MTDSDLRYCPERNFPASPYLPGRGAHPSSSSTSVPSDQTWDGVSATLVAQREYLWGVDLYNSGFYWEAHESWEGLWQVAENNSVARDFLQGLIQCAAAVLKSSLGQIAGFESLADKGFAKLVRVMAAGNAVYGGIDLQQFRRDFGSYRDTARDASDRARAPRIVLEPASL